MTSAKPRAGANRERSEARSRRHRAAPPRGRLAIYGASGFTGTLIARAACAAGLRPLLCGRDARRVASIAAPLGLQHQVATLDDAAALTALLRDVDVVLNAAGPFSASARPIVDACLNTSTHYLDVTGELGVIEQLASRADDARRRGVMLLPAVGFEVVPSDCLAAHVVKLLGEPASQLRIAVTPLPYASRGSAKTLIELAAKGVEVRRAGRLVPAPAGSLQRRFDLGAGLQRALNVSLADLSTAYHTTGVPNVETYLCATPPLEAMIMADRAFGWLTRQAPMQAWLRSLADFLPQDPVGAAGSRREMVIVAEAEGAGGTTAVARLRTPEAYGFTAQCAVAVARSVLGGDVRAGFQTPAGLLGPDFVLGLEGVQREDLVRT